MQFDLEKSIEILERTPQVLHTLLSGLSAEWTMSNEGPETWSPFDVVGHLIHGEKTDWIPRMQLILAGSQEPFPVFDRFAQFEESAGKTMQELLQRFSQLRNENINTLKSSKLSALDLGMVGIHPEFGEITLKQLLATWTAHDLGHIHQISRVMARQYQDEVGPWIRYLGVLASRS